MTADRLAEVEAERLAQQRLAIAEMRRANRLQEKVARVEALLTMTPPAKYDAQGNYEGRVGGTEHRTTGGRAWCYQCSEWCYPESYACPCCEPRIDPDDLRAALSREQEETR